MVNLYGCMSQGKTKKEAQMNAKKAIKAYMQVIKNTESDKEISKEIVNLPISFASA